MKRIPCTIVGNTSYGHCFSPKECQSISEAKEYGKWMIEEGFWFAYRIKKNISRV